MVLLGRYNALRLPPDGLLSPSTPNAHSCPTSLPERLRLQSDTGFPPQIVQLSQRSLSLSPASTIKNERALLFDFVLSKTQVATHLTRSSPSTLNYGFLLLSLSYH
jgi:hypothetical protein